MANFFDIDAALRAEVIDRLEALVPNRPIQSHGGRFKFYHEEFAETTPITEFTGCPRTFWIGTPIEVNPHFYVGGGTVGRTYQYPLIIVYRTEQKWSSAMMDDVESIRSSLLNSTDGGTSGVQARFVAREVVVEVTPFDDDPWQYVTIPVWALLDIS